jgi:hypothetical protein
MRAQAGFITMIGILLVVVLVIYYASQVFLPNLTPTGTGEEQRMVEGMVESIITTGAESALEAMELQGGYISYPERGVLFTNVVVPYWQICQNDVSPTLAQAKQRLEKGIEYYFNNHTQDIKDFFGKNLSIENVSDIDVRILDNKIDVYVTAATRFQDTEIKQPYVISVPTKFKEIFSFAKDAIAEINRHPSQGGRFFETFTMASLYRSRYLPTIGFLTRCGQYIRLGPQQISSALMGLVSYTITHFDWWKDMPSEDTYAIDRVNGRQYLDLDPMLSLPQNFEIRYPGSINIRNNNWISTVFPAVIPYCTNAYDIKYSFGYPVVISTRDAGTGYDFNFAVYVSIGEMKPADCDIMTDSTGTIADPCEDLECDASIKVVDCEGRPIEKAEAYFGECPIGTSGSDGMISGKIACDALTLDIYHDENYSYYSQTVSFEDINGVYELCRIPELTIRFSEVYIEDFGVNEYTEGEPVETSCHECVTEDCASSFHRTRTECSSVPSIGNCIFIELTPVGSGGDPYIISNSDPSRFAEECGDREYAETHRLECSGCGLGEIVRNDIPAGKYDVVARLYDPEDYSEIGYLEERGFELREGTTILAISIPRFGGASQSGTEEWQKECIVKKMGEECFPSIESLVQK